MGGKVKSEAQMEREHAAWMKKNGAPKRMVREEMAEAKEEKAEYACGGKVKKKPKKFAGAGMVGARPVPMPNGGPQRGAGMAQAMMQRLQRGRPAPMLGKGPGFAKGGPVDDLTPRSNLPDKNAVEQEWERKQAAKKPKKPDPKMVEDAVKRGAIREYAKGGVVRGVGCAKKGKNFRMR